MTKFKVGEKAIWFNETNNKAYCSTVDSIKIEGRGIFYKISYLYKFYQQTMPMGMAETVGYSEVYESNLYKINKKDGFSKLKEINEKLEELKEAFEKRMNDEKYVHRKDIDRLFNNQKDD